MYDIPKPQVLDPDRPLRRRGAQFTEDDRPEAELLAIALHESCDYAEQLWEDLNAMRRYLLESLPPYPRSPGEDTTAAASPTGPDDEQGWQNWINAFGEVTSVLCGPHGDSGFGLSRAREEAQIRRRTAPVSKIRAEHPDLDAAARAVPGGPQAAEAADRPGTHSDTDLVGPGPGPRWSAARVAGGMAIGMLALRGLLRPRRRDALRQS